MVLLLCQLVSPLITQLHSIKIPPPSLRIILFIAINDILIVQWRIPNQHNFSAFHPRVSYHWMPKIKYKFPNSKERISSSTSIPCSYNHCRNKVVHGPSIDHHDNLLFHNSANSFIVFGFVILIAKFKNI